LEAAIDDCLSRSQEDLDRMGAEGFTRIVKHHSVETEAARLAELFRAGNIG
jgi:colanic acid/amylovoran biosynthesis glycosyltransferase